MDEEETPKIKISCKDLWKVFGPDPEHAIKLVKKGMTKEKVLERTGHVIAVKDASLDVYEGEIFVVMGLSGSGKSTLARCLNRLIEPTRGQILIDEVNIGAMNAAELRQLRRHKMSMVFQTFALFPHRSVIDNAAYGLEIQGVGKAERHKKAQEVLKLVGLKGWENSYIHELSGGMQQRVGLARAFAVDPEILLMDEPFSALDPLIRRQLQDEFLNLMAEVQKTIVFITHDLNEALKLGSRIAIMKDGEIVQLGTPEEIVSAPADDYVTEFVRDVPKAKVVPVKNVMREPEVTLYSWQGPKVALHDMRASGTQYAFIMDPGRRLRGLITADEAKQAIKDGVTRLSKAAIKDSIQIGGDQLLEDLIPLSATTTDPVAVVDENGRLIGEVRHTDVLLGIAGEESSSDEESSKEDDSNNTEKQS